MYRALISVPIEADSEAAAEAQAYEYANSLCHPGSACIAGHVEVFGESNGMDFTRVLWVDPGFRLSQLDLALDALERCATKLKAEYDRQEPGAGPEECWAEAEHAWVVLRELS